MLSPLLQPGNTDTAVREEEPGAEETLVSTSARKDNLRCATLRSPPSSAQQQHGLGGEGEQGAGGGVLHLRGVLGALLHTQPCCRVVWQPVFPPSCYVFRWLSCLDTPPPPSTLLSTLSSFQRLLSRKRAYSHLIVSFL